MTGQKRPLVNYLEREDFEIIHSIVSERWKEDGEPIPPFTTANEHNLDALVKISKSNYFGEEQYPSLESKAAIIFYTLNKKHIFSNGNKRLSVACLVIFLMLNGKVLKVEPNEMTEKALELAKTSHEHHFGLVKSGLEAWIRDRMVDSDSMKS